MRNVVIIPTYNERQNISPLIREILKLNPEIEVLVVDDNSPDGTAGEVKKLIATLPGIYLLERTNKGGLAGAYLAAFKNFITDKNVDKLIMMDADFSHDPADIRRLTEAAEKNNLVIGSRYVKGGSIAEWELWRRLLSWGGNTYVKLILRQPINDWTSGFMCIRADLLEKIDLEKIDLSGYAFLQELKYLLLKAGARAKEIPIRFGVRRGGESKMSPSIIREGIIGPWKILWRK